MGNRALAGVLGDVLCGVVVAQRTLTSVQGLLPRDLVVRDHFDGDYRRAALRLAAVPDLT